MTEIGRHTFHFDPMRQDPGSVTQYPLRLAYAMTIHKSQGLTLDRALIDIRAAREPGQAYVALSRLRGLGSIQRIVTPQGLVKFIAARTRDGHADRATALALALHAAEKHPEGMGLSERAPALTGVNRRRHHPMRTRFATAWR